MKRWKDVLGFEPMLYKEGSTAPAKHSKDMAKRVKREQKRGVRYETFM
jgi:hypothetical protein